MVLVAIAGCSSVTNTIAGLTTPQSTISGSNYVFFVDPKIGQLRSQQPHLPSPSHVHKGDHFQITLDFGFLRYLQAVDPYVIVYSETWMGNEARPTDAEQTLRQVVLIKEGMAQNSRLPVTSVPLLGPVTMGDDLLDVHVTLKVVVLSKRDNAQTIQLVEGLAGLASAAAPQYAMASGAAAATVAAFIAQNRDKVEFEHTFSFAPDGLPIHTSPSDDHHSHLILEEGQIAVLKGESRFRSVPYHTWYYYLWPFNWFGLTPDRTSRRFENDERPQYTGFGNLIRLPSYLVASFFTDAEGDAFGTDSLRDTLEAAGLKLNEMTSYMPKPSRQSTAPSDLFVDGYQMIVCDPPNTQGGVDNAKANAKKKDTHDSDRERCPFKVTHEYEGASIFPLSVILRKSVDRFNLYSEKTHFVVGISKTKGTLGLFEEVKGKFSVHGEAIKAVTTSSSQADAISTEKVKNAFDSVRKAVLFDRAKRSLREDADKGTLPAMSDAFLQEHEIDKAKQTREYASLVDTAVDSLVQRTIVYNLQCVDAAFKGDAADKKKAFEEALDCVKGQMWKWDEIESDQWKRWTTGWQRVLDETKHAILLKQCGQVDNGSGSCLDKEKWETLKAPDRSIVRLKDAPPVDEGDVGYAEMKFSVEVFPLCTCTLKLAYHTADDTAKAGTDYVPAKGYLVFENGEDKKEIVVQIIGNTGQEGNRRLKLVLDDLHGGVAQFPGNTASVEAFGTIQDNDP